MIQVKIIRPTMDPSEWFYCPSNVKPGEPGFIHALHPEPRKGYDGEPRYHYENGQVVYEEMVPAEQIPFSDETNPIYHNLEENLNKALVELQTNQNVEILDIKLGQSESAENYNETALVIYKLGK